MSLHSVALGRVVRSKDNGERGESFIMSSNSTWTSRSQPSDLPARPSLCNPSLSRSHRRSRHQSPQRDIIHDVLTPLDIVFQTIEPSPEGIVSKVQE